MTKEKILSVLLISIGLFAFASVNAAPPENKPEGKPFEELREDIAVLQEEVFEKEKSGIWEAVRELQNRVGVLENQAADLINRVTDLENWKAIIEEWKVFMENKIVALELEVGELWNKLHSVQAEIAELWTALKPSELLSKVKQVDGSGSGLDADLLDSLDSTSFVQTNGSYPDLSVGYATSAGNADMVDGKHASELLSLWSDGGGYIYPNNVGATFQVTDAGDLYVSSNIGINTAGPTQKLHIFSDDNDAAIRLETGQRPGSHNFTIGVDSSDNKFKINVGHHLGYANQFVMEEGGNIGIGTPYPQYALHVESYRPGNWAASIVNTAASSNGYGLLLESLSSDSSAYNLFEVTNKEGTKFFIRGDGNIGIGTLEPAEKLTVAGTIQSTSGGIKFPDGTVQTTASSGGFKIYDSGWFPCSTGGTYDKTHNFNNTAIIVMLYFATDSNGSNMQNVSDGFRDYEGEERGGIIKNISATTFTVQAGATYVHTGLDSDGNRIDYSSGYYKVIAIAFSGENNNEIETEENLPPISEESSTPEPTPESEP